MSEASFETVLGELRATAPPAPETLRERVRGLPSTHRRHAPRLRRALVAAVAAAVVFALGTAVIGGLTTERSSAPEDAARGRAVQDKGPRPAASVGGPTQLAPSSGERFAPSLTAKSRLQRQDVSMNLRVENLSDATQSAVRTTRRLGGYVAGADYSTTSTKGNSRLALRVPVVNLQNAIARFTALGTILAQHISVLDLQGGLDRLDTRIAVLHKRVPSLDGAGRAKAERTLSRLERTRAALIREGSYARVSLQLTTHEPAAKHVEPGRFGRFWDNAADILGKEAIAVLYALVVVGPFVLLAALVILGERARRRRADHRLLEETG